MLRIEDSAQLEDLLRLNRVVHGWHVGAYPELFRNDSEEEFRAYYAAALANPDMRHFVACDGSTAIGFTQVEIRTLRASPFRRASRIAYVNVIVVDTSWQRKGAGRALIERVRRFATEQRLERVELDHWDGNPAAEFFRAMGFRPYRHYLWLT